ncbi:Protein RALF-like [Actinidia chinensis var. chinensis]|uniref:Protein RALF-like n=1 Tax=Actinidia chinensis var. chinensis TaxID=1590841 RepID=A0A2R6QPI5_ACTCC|nr:Protein RALF-like [Actinidia chinensis var. chinensis]
MAASNGLIVFFLGALLLCTHMTTSTVDAKEINYGDLRNGKGKQNLPTTPANPYTRGCSDITRCRKGIGDQVLLETPASAPGGMMHAHGAST